MACDSSDDGNRPTGTRKYSGNKRRSSSPDRLRESHKRPRYSDEREGRKDHRSRRRTEDDGENTRLHRSHDYNEERRRRDSAARKDGGSHIKSEPRSDGPVNARLRSRSRSPVQSHGHRDEHRSRRHRSKSCSRSPKRRRRPSVSRSPPPRSRKPLPSQDQSFQQQGRDGSDTKSGEGALDRPQEKQKPNYKPTGLLAAESNKVTISGGKGKDPKQIALRYHEPSEARKPPSSQAWTCYVFKGDSKDPIDTIPLHARSCWLLGRETAVVDIPTEHPSCSKQHAALQFRYIEKKNEYGEKKGRVRLYVIDIGSANGTFLNDERLEEARYVECLDNDILKFGDSEREYVVLLPKKA